MNTKPLSICLVSQEYPPETGGGGIGTQTYLRSQGLTARGHAVHVVAMSWDAQERTYNDGAAVVHRVPQPEPGFGACEQSTHWMSYSFAVARRLAAVQADVKFDVIQFPEYGGEGFVYLTDSFAYRKAKYVVQMHGPIAMFAEHWGWPAPGSPLHRIGGFMEQMSLQCADMLLSSSRHTAEYCQKAYGVETSGAGIVYSGIDVERFAPRDVPRDGAGPHVLFVGGLSAGKGFHDVMRAVGKLKGRFPGIRLRAIGRATEERRRDIDRLIVETGIADHFELIGYVPYNELPLQYAWCDVFAAPSVYEGGPGNVYLEAMACGKPVIACNTGGIPEVAPHMETGVLVPPRDLGAVVEALELLCGDPSTRARMGAAARRRVQDEFTIQRYLDKCEAHYRELTA